MSGFDNPFDGLDPGFVAKGARLVAQRRPPAVTVHDNGDMARDPLRASQNLCFEYVGGRIIHESLSCQIRSKVRRGLAGGK